MVKGVDIFSDEPLSDEDKVEYLGESITHTVVNFFADCDLNSDASFAAMSRGYGFYIIANSSFSYWAARISESLETKVYCPNPWFKDMDSPRYLYPELWLQVTSIFHE
jgi:tRNA(Met) C34 N-acetyltransferase TmcA